MDMFTAVAQPRRRQILEMLARHGELTATQIFEKFPVTAPAISQHLKVLRETKLVDIKRQSRKRIYSVNPTSLITLERWARHMVHAWSERPDSLRRSANR